MRTFKQPLLKLSLIGFFFATLILSGCSEEPATDASENAAMAPVLTTIATGANIAGSNGLAFSADNKLYVASVIGSTISIIDPDSGEMLKTLTVEDGVVGPDDLLHLVQTAHISGHQFSPVRLPVLLLTATKWLRLN